MKISLQATSIIEAMVVLLIVVFWITWVYSLMSSSTKLADATGKRIEAIQIARDGLESLSNIRDSNWLKFAADYENCWNTYNYDTNCIGGGGASIWTGSYIVYRNIHNQFEIQPATSAWDYASATYRNRFAIAKNSDGFYTQSGGTLYGAWGNPFYTREIQIRYNSPYSMNINSIVQWQDIAKNTAQKLEMSTTLTNWKAKK